MTLSLTCHDNCGCVVSNQTHEIGIIQLCMLCSTGKTLINQAIDAKDSKKDKLLRKDDGDKKTKATVVPKEATGKDGRANQVDVARRSYLEAATRAGE